MRQLRRLGDRVARFTQSANCSMLRGVRFASAVLVRGSCYFDALALPFASHLVIVIRDLRIPAKPVHDSGVMPVQHSAVCRSTVPA